MKTGLRIFTVGLLFIFPALADDMDDVTEAVEAYFTSLNTGNVDGWIELFTEGHTTFAGGGGMLERADSLEEQRRVRQAGVDAGLARNLAGRHIEVRIYGMTAVATNYVVGTLPVPGGTPQRILRRRTAVLVKQGDRWKIVHRHISSLNLP
jgi:ketosteroid isomerase-like protein